MSTQTSLSKSDRVKWLISILLTAAIWLTPTNSIFTPAMRSFSSLTALAMLLLAFELTPIFVPAVLLPVGYTLFHVAPKEVIYNAWTGQVPWVLIGSMLVASILEKTGLSKRIAYRTLLLARGNLFVLMFTFLLAGIIVGAFVPASMARTALFGTIMLSLCQAMGYKANSKYALIGFATVYIVSNDVSMSWMTASNANIILTGLMASAGVPVGWIDYAVYSLVPSVIWMSVEIIVLFILYSRREVFQGGGTASAHQTREYLREQYAGLGPMGTAEKKALIFVCIIVLLLLTSNLHVLNPGQIFILTACAAFLPGINIAGNDDLKAINFSMVLLVVGCISIGDVASSMGVGKLMVTSLIPHMPRDVFGLSAFVAGLCFIGNMLMTPLALVSGLTVPIVELCNSIGVNPIGMCFIFWLSCMSILLPYETTTALLMYSYNMMSIKEFIKIFLVKTVITFIATFAIFIPWLYVVGAL